MKRRAEGGNRTPPGWRAASLAVALLVGSTARANLRAPVVVRESPSTALSGAGPGLTVTGESLRFECSAQACDVAAEYAVTAAEAVRVRLELVLPVEGPVTAVTNGAAGAVSVVPAVPLRPAEARTLPPAEPGAPPLYRAAFESAFRTGANTVAVRYRQPLGAEEIGYGYGKKAGRMVQRFRYELWPLREWSRGPGFRIRLAVALERPQPGWWRSRFGQVKSVTCLSSDSTAPQLSARREQRGDWLWYEAEIGPSVPDRITCYLGDDDLMPRY